MARKTKINDQDITNQKFGKLMVIKYIGKDKNRKALWLCKCDCGNETIKDIYNLTSGKVISCGCVQKDFMKSRKIEMIGKCFEYLTVLSESEYKGNNGKETYYICKCKCGNEFEILGTQLRRNNRPTKSCGCLSSEKTTKHNKCNTRLYKIYDGMKYRCYNTNATYYNNYGGRGIVICDEWLNTKDGFINFYNWAMENGYDDNLSIDRINNDGNYEPDNCRWATPKEQANNRRDNMNIEINGETHTMSEWGEISGLGDNLIRARILNDWDTNDLINPKYKRKVN